MQAGIMKFLFPIAVLLSSMATGMASKCCWPVDPRNYIKLNHACDFALDEVLLGKDVTAEIDLHIKNALGNTRKLHEGSDAEEDSLPEFEPVKFLGVTEIVPGEVHRALKAEEAERKLAQERELLSIDKPKFLAALEASQCSVPGLNGARRLQGEDETPTATTDVYHGYACQGCGAMVCWKTKDICDVLVDVVLKIKIEVTWKTVGYFNEIPVPYSQYVKYRGDGYVIWKKTFSLDIKVKTTYVPNDPWDCNLWINWDLNLSIWHKVSFEGYLVVGPISFYGQRIKYMSQEHWKLDLANGSVDVRLGKIFKHICPKLYGDYCDDRDGAIKMDPHIMVRILRPETFLCAISLPELTTDVHPSVLSRPGMITGM
jgi:hypothetical protein